MYGDVTNCHYNVINNQQTQRGESTVIAVKHEIEHAYLKLLSRGECLNEYRR